MKVYIASFFADKDRVAARAKDLQAMGIECTMRWPFETAPHSCTIKDFPDEYFRETAVFDLEDIDSSDVMILMVPTDTQMADQPLRSMVRGGRHFESGYMYGLARSGRKKLIVLGPRENVFHFLDGESVTAKYPVIQHFDTWDQTVQYLYRRNQEEL